MFESLLLLSFNLLLVLFIFFLSCNYLQESVALSSCLLCVHDFFFQELLLASLFKFCSQHLLSKQLVFLLLSRLSFTFFIGAFRSQGIDFTLSISSTLLEFTQTLDLKLFLVSLPLFFECGFFLLSCLLPVVFNDLSILSLFKIDFFLFLYLGNSIRGLNFLNHLEVALPLLLCSISVLLLLDLDSASHLSLFLLKNFTFFLSLDFSVFDLVNYNGCATPLSFNSCLFSLFSDLESFESLDLHHQIKAFLFVDPVFFKSFVLIKLLVSDGNDF